MSIAITKVELAKRLLETNDIGIINHIKAVFESHTTDWWEELPDEVRDRVEKGIREADRGEGISHDQVMKKYSKWLKRK